MFILGWIEIPNFLNDLSQWSFFKKSFDRWTLFYWLLLLQKQRYIFFTFHHDLSLLRHLIVVNLFSRQVIAAISAQIGFFVLFGELPLY